MDCCDFKSCALLNWSDIRFSGLVLGSLNLAFILHWTSDLNLYSICAYLLFFYIATGVVQSKFMKTHEPESGDNYEHVSKEQVENMTKKIFRWGMEVDTLFQRVISLEDAYLSMKFFITLLSIATFSPWFSDCYIIWLVINILFAYNPIYNMNKDLIDSTYENVSNSVSEYLTLVNSLIPRYVEKN